MSNHRYKNYCVPCYSESQIESCYKARGIECDSITQASQMVQPNGYGWAVRVYYGQDSGDVVAYRIWY